MNFFQKILYGIVIAFFPNKIYGKENIPKDSGALLVGNHSHALDFLFAMKACDKKDLNIVAKKEIFKNKFIGAVAKWYGAIPLDREKVDMKALVSVMKVLKSGKKLLIYPEGTRNKGDASEMLPFRNECFIFAIKTKVPVVPIMLLKKTKFLGKNRIIIGKPFYLDQFYDKKLGDEDLVQVGDFVRGKMEQARQELAVLVAKK